MSIRKELYKRFDELEAAIPDSMQSRNQALRVLADETIRQMKWARFDGMDGDRDKPFDVSLAPPDWKPS